MDRCTEASPFIDPNRRATPKETIIMFDKSRFSKLLYMLCVGVLIVAYSYLGKTNVMLLWMLLFIIELIKFFANEIIEYIDSKFIKTDNITEDSTDD